MRLRSPARSMALLPLPCPGHHATMARVLKGLCCWPGCCRDDMYVDHPAKGQEPVSWAMLWPGRLCGNESRGLLRLMSSGLPVPDGC